MSEVNIRIASIDDAVGLAELDNECFTVNWSVAAYKSNFTHGGFFVLAEADDKIIGFAGMNPVLDEGMITNITVSPGYRRQNIASLILERFFQEGKRMGIKTYFLEVRKSNDPALGLYEKFNFKEIGIRKEYYPDNKEDAIIMAKYEDEE